MTIVAQFHSNGIFCLFAVTVFQGLIIKSSSVSSVLISPTGDITTGTRVSNSTTSRARPKRQITKPFYPGDSIGYYPGEYPGTGLQYDPRMDRRSRQRCGPPSRNGEVYNFKVLALYDQAVHDQMLRKANGVDWVAEIKARQLIYKDLMDASIILNRLKAARVGLNLWGGDIYHVKKTEFPLNNPRLSRARSINSAQYYREFMRDYSYLLNDNKNFDHIMLYSADPRLTGMSGVADMGMMCDRRRSGSLVVEDGQYTPKLIAHEIGRSIGLRDDSAGCQVPATSRSIMNRPFDLNADWSSCSEAQVINGHICKYRGETWQIRVKQPYFLPDSVSFDLIRSKLMTSSCFRR